MSSKSIFWVSVVFSAIRDFVTDVSNIDVAMVFLAGMAAAVAYRYIFERNDV